MAQQYMILMEPDSLPRVSAATATRGGTRAGGPKLGVKGVKVKPPATHAMKVEKLKSGEAREAARDKKVAAIAPVMPMRLIAPMRAASATGKAATNAWGISAVRADVSSLDGSGVVVAVLDTGIDPKHPAFAVVELVRKNFTSEKDDDLHGHGTHCAGTIFGRDVNGTRIGIARGVSKAVIGKVLGEGGGGSDRVAGAVMWALDQGANVISMSLGIDFPGYVQQLINQGLPADLATSYALEGYRSNILLFERLTGFVNARSLMAQPCVVVAAAGNESKRAVKKDYEISVSPPAVADGIISVAALGPGPGGWRVADFSNTGARVSGPGVGILSAKPGGGLVLMDGTSMATPHVAGVAALWAQKLAAEGDLRLPQWTDRMLGAATKTGMKAGFDPTDIGSGMIQAPKN